jgi:hypothetical protein
MPRRSRARIAMASAISQEGARRRACAGPKEAVSALGVVAEAEIASPLEIWLARERSTLRVRDARGTR